MRLRPVLAAVLFLLISASSASALDIRPFTAVRFEDTVTGDIDLVGNTVLTCSTAATTTCAQARNRVGADASLSNNGQTMQYVDADTDPTTFNSSFSDFDLDSDATVLYARLYWTGRNAPTPAQRNQVRFTTPDGAQAVTATQLDVNGASNDYSASVDVTELVELGGAGEYGVANVQTAQNNINLFGGWTLVVAVEDPDEPIRALTVFDGYANVQSGDPADVVVSGFLTPYTGDVVSKIGVITGEGDLGITGDGATLTSPSPGGTATPFADAQNPSTNFANSSYARGGSLRTGNRRPEYGNLLGFDMDILNFTNAIPNGATNAAISLTSTGDQYEPMAVTIVTDMYYANLTSTSSQIINDVNGGRIEPGDELEIVVTLNNTGVDGAENVISRGPVPVGTGYVPGSLAIVAGPNAGPQTDAGADDVGRFDSGLNRVIVNAGTGATSSAGGAIPVSGSTQYSYRVVVDPASTNGTLVSSQARTTLTGATSGRPGSSRTQPNPQVVSVPAELSLAIDHADPFVRGRISPVNITVSDAVASPSFGPVTVTGSVGSGLEIVGATGATCTITNSGSDYECTLDADVPGNGSESFFLSVRPTQSSPASASVTGLVSGGTDQTPTDNDASDTINIVSDADLAVSIDAPDRANTGATLSVVGTLVNNGPSDAVGDKSVTFNLGDLAFSSFTGTGWSCTAAGSLVVCEYAPDLPSGATAPTVSISAVAPATGGSRSVSIAVSENPTANTVLGNDTASDTVFVVAAPTGVDDTGIVAEDGTTVIDAAFNDVASPGGGTVVVSGVDDPAHGTATIVGGQVQYVPDADFNGVDEFDYTLTDGNGRVSTATITVTITAVNDAPVADDDSATTKENTAVNLQPLVGDTDVDGDSLSVASVDQPANGTTVLELDGTVTYTPNPGFTGVDTFVYRASDGALEDEGEVTVIVGASADLRISLSQSPADPIPAGGRATITYRVDNDGPSTATNATVNVDLPANATLVSKPDSCNVSGDDLVCLVGDIASGSSVSDEIVVRVPENAAGSSLSTVATATSDIPDPSPATDDEDLVVGPSSRLVVDAAFVEQPRAGEPAIYRITVRNDGPNDATGVSITDALPAGFRIVSSTPETGECTVDGARTRCEIGTVPSGATRTITVVVEVPTDAGDRDFAHDLDAVSPTPEPEPSVGRRSAEPPFTVLPLRPVDPPVNSRVDIGVDQRVAAGSSAAGETVTYLVTVTNRSAVTARDVFLTNAFTLDRNDETERFRARRQGTDDLVVLDATVPSGTCEVDEDTVRCNLGDLAAGESRTITVRVKPMRAGSIVSNTVTSTPSGDVALENNSDRLGVVVGEGRSRIAVKLVANRTRVKAGSAFRYELTIRNTDPTTPALNVRVCQRLPDGFTVRRLREARLERGVPCWRVEAIRPGGTITLGLDVRAPKNAKSGSRLSDALARSTNAASDRDDARVRVLALARDGRNGGATG